MYNDESCALKKYSIVVYKQTNRQANKHLKRKKINKCLFELYVISGVEKIKINCLHCVHLYDRVYWFANASVTPYHWFPLAFMWMCMCVHAYLQRILCVYAVHIELIEFMHKPARIEFNVDHLHMNYPC